MSIVKSGPIGLGNPAGTVEDIIVQMNLAKSSRTMNVQVYHRITPPFGGTPSAAVSRGISGSLQGYTDHIVQSSSSYLDDELSITKTLSNTNVGSVSSSSGWNTSNGYPSGTFFDGFDAGHTHFATNQVIPNEFTYNGPITPGVYISGNSSGFGTTSNISSTYSGTFGGGGTPGVGSYSPPVFTYQGLVLNISQLLWFKNTQTSGPFDSNFPYYSNSLLSSTVPTNGNFLVLALKGPGGGTANFKLEHFPKTLSIGSSSFNFADATMEFDTNVFVTFVWELTSTQADTLNSTSSGILVKLTDTDRKNGIAEEFGGDDNSDVRISDYYAGGGITPSGITGIPTSGQIKFSDFHDTSSIVTNTYSATGTSAMWGKGSRLRIGRVITSYYVGGAQGSGGTPSPLATTGFGLSLTCQTAAWYEGASSAGMGFRWEATSSSATGANTTWWNKVTISRSGQTDVVLLRSDATVNQHTNYRYSIFWPTDSTPNYIANGAFTWTFSS